MGEPERAQIGGARGGEHPPPADADAGDLGRGPSEPLHLAADLRGVVLLHLVPVRSIRVVVHVGYDASIQHDRSLVWRVRHERES